MFLKSENKRTRNVWVTWLITLVVVLLHSALHADWARLAGGLTGTALFALGAYLTVGLPFTLRRED